MSDRMRSGILLGMVLSLAGCGGGCPSAPPARTPVLEAVFKPIVSPGGGSSLGNIGISGGEFEVLPSSSVIIWFRAPYPTGLEVDVNGAVLEQTNNVSRQQALEAQGLGFWFHESGSPDVNVSGDPRWKIVVAAAPNLRVSQRFAINLTNTSSNASAPRSTPLTVRVALGIPDWVSLANNTGNDDAVVLLDGQRTWYCADDEIWRGKRIIDVGDVRSMGPCNEEVVVFSRDDAMQLVARNVVWTDSLRDYVEADLSPDLWQAPVTVWLLGTGLQNRAQNDVTRANGLYNNSRCGIGFNANLQTADNNNARALIGNDDANMCGGAWITALTGSAFFTAGQINVYYTNVALPTARGLMCTNNQNIIVISTTADNESLAHELGHSFTLGHSNGINGIPNTNVMITGGGGRTEFTEGQCFRMNLNPASTLNSNLVRRGWLRNCPDGTTNNQCPALSLDVP